MGLLKVEKYRNKKICESAIGEPCTMRLQGVCNHDWDTTVWAHSPFEEDGHGTSTKSHDCFGCYACSACHDVLDGRAPAPLELRKMYGPGQFRKEVFHRAMKRSWLRLLAKGVLR